MCVGQVFVSITLGSLSFDPRCVSFRQHLNAQGYKCLDKTFGRIYISHDAIFDESRFPFGVSSISNSPSLTSKIIYVPQTEQTIINDHMQNYDLSCLCYNVSNVAATPLAPNPNQLIQNQRSMMPNDKFPYFHTYTNVSNPSQ